MQLSSFAEEGFAMRRGFFCKSLTTLFRDQRVPQHIQLR
jgi:hypothetical protein